MCKSNTFPDIPSLHVSGSQGALATPKPIALSSSKSSCFSFIVSGAYKSLSTRGSASVFVDFLLFVRYFRRGVAALKSFCVRTCL